MASAIDSATLDNASKWTSSSEKIQENHEKYKDLIQDSDNTISSDTFMKLLVAEMTNQDPLEPTSNTEFISQLAQFSAMQYMQDASKYSMADYATSLLGKTVSASKLSKNAKDAEIITGVVTKVAKNKKGDSYNITINDETFDINRVISVVGSSADVSGGMSNTSLGSTIANAAYMIGMEAEVKQSGTFEDGSGIVDSGIISAVTVADGKVKVVINGLPFDLDSITTLKYADSNETQPDDKTDETGGADNTQSTDKNESTDKIESTENTDEIDSNVPATQSEDIQDLNFEDMEAAMTEMVMAPPVVADSNINMDAERQSLIDSQDIEDLVDF